MKKNFYAAWAVAASIIASPMAHGKNNFVQTSENVLAGVTTAYLINTTPNCANDSNHHFDATVKEKRSLLDVVRQIPRNAIVLVGDGDHNTPDVKYLISHIAVAAAQSGSLSRFYVEGIGIVRDKSGLAPLTQAIIPNQNLFQKAGDVSSLLVMYQTLAYLKAHKKIEAFVADNSEGDPAYDSGLMYLGEETVQRFAAANEKLIKQSADSPIDEEEFEPIVRHFFAPYAKNHTEYRAFVQTAINGFTYSQQEGWDNDVQINVPIRLGKDAKLTIRVAQDAQNYPNSMMVIPYGAAHFRENGSPSVSAMLRKLFPDRPVIRLMIHPSMKKLVQAECDFNLTVGGGFAVIVDKGTIPAPVIPSNRSVGRATTKKLAR